MSSAESKGDPGGLSPADGNGPAGPLSALRYLFMQPRFVAFLLAALTLITFWPIHRFDFVNYDDGDYFYANPHVLAGLTRGGVAWAFQSPYAGNWHPLTWISLMADAQVFGGGPAGPHIINLLWHVANTVLLFGVLRKLTGATLRSGLVAALFALHPLHVESVAWISERKDVLSAFFFLATLWAYARFVEESTPQRCMVANFAQQRERQARRGTFRPAWIATRRALFYFVLALLLYSFGLMAKPMVVTLPFVLLLLDYWPLQRFRELDIMPQGGVSREPAPRFRVSTLVRLTLEKAPFFLLSIISSVITYLSQEEAGATRSLDGLSLSGRFENALVAYARYLGKTIWPADLAVFYPHPGHWAAALVVGAAALMVILSVAALWSGRKYPFAVTGWFWFCGTLVPVIGIVQVGNQAMANRYTYLPLIGVFVIAVWGVRTALVRAPQAKLPAAFTAGGLLLACALLTRGQLAHWQDGEHLFRYAIASTENNALAHNNLGDVLLRQNRVDEAITNYQQAIRIDPVFALPHNNLGIALAAKGKFTEAMGQYLEALRIDPAYAKAQVNLADALAATRKYDEAITHYRQALRLDPNSAQALNNLGIALLRNGNLDEAIDTYQQMADRHVDSAGAHKNFGKALVLKGRFKQAAEHLDQALRLEPEDPEIHYWLALALEGQGQRNQAIGKLTEALRLRPNYSEAQEKLSELQARAIGTR